jgi:hypothetical protein
MWGGPLRERQSHPVDLLIFSKGGSVTKLICNCRGLACHDAKVDLKLVHFASRVGGKGVHAVLSAECRARRTGFKEVIA